MTTTHASLLARVAAAGAGGPAYPEAWEEFCDRYGQLIANFARRQGLQPADCEDVQQEVLLTLTKALPGFVYDPEKGKFRSYLKTVVVHAAQKRFRKKAHGERALEIDPATTAAAADDPSVDQQWEIEWRQYHLRQAMRSIEVEFAASDVSAFEQYAVQGRPVREVADALGLSVDQVYQAKSRILKRLSAQIEQQVADEG